MTVDLNPIPPEWRQSSFGRFARVLNGTDYAGVEVDSGGYPVYGSGGEFRRASDYLYEGESVLFGRKGTVDRPLYVNGRFWTVDTMFYTDIDTRALLPKFAYYWATTLPYGGWATDTALPSMTSTAIKAAPIAVPPLAEQRAIADFLDRETAQIDAFIAKNEQVIALLTERRVAAITAAIATPGRTSVWVALRFIATVLDCKHVTAEPAEGDESFSVASVREVGGKWVDVANARRTSRDSFLNLGEGGRQLRAWDLVVCRNASVGKVSIVPPGIEPTVLGQDVSLIRVAGANPGIARFVYYSLTSAIGVDAFEQASIGSTFRRINVDDIKSLRLPSVDGEEGEAIADSLDAISARIDSAIGTAQRSIDLARERRGALISAAVTGKIDVGVSP